MSTRVPFWIAMGAGEPGSAAGSVTAATWETDHHPGKTVTTYASSLVQYATAMKAVDPSSKVGAVLTTPGSWPDGITGPGDTMESNAPDVGIAVTEANANAYKDTSPNGLFAPDEYLTWRENGAFALDRVRAPRSTALVSVHAVRRKNGDVSVLLINKDPANAATGSATRQTVPACSSWSYDSIATAEPENADPANAAS